jgi:hypothetical protein
MTEQIIKIEPDNRDEGCLLITLRHLPSRLCFWRSNKSYLAVYKGHADQWYHIPSFKPAPSRLIPLLKAISYGPQYKHLRYKFK